MRRLLFLIVLAYATTASAQFYYNGNFYFPSPGQVQQDLDRYTNQMKKQNPPKFHFENPNNNSNTNTNTYNGTSTNNNVSSSNKTKNSNTSSSNSSSKTTYNCAYCNGTGKILQEKETTRFGLGTKVRGTCSYCGRKMYEGVTHAHLSCTHCHGTGKVSY